MKKVTHINDGNSLDILKYLHTPISFHKTFNNNELGMYNGIGIAHSLRNSKIDMIK
jgi:hypothetical protein